jgi:hypothetical protein
VIVHILAPLHIHCAFLDLHSLVIGFLIIVRRISAIVSLFLSDAPEDTGYERTICDIVLLSKRRIVLQQKIVCVRRGHGYQYEKENGCESHL